jgi:exosome complex component RRP42
MGRVECHVEFAPGSLVDGDAETLGVDLGKSLQVSLADGRALPLEALCIEAGHFCWTVYIDGVVNGCGGNLLDTLSIGVRAALATARVPRVRAVPSDDGSGALELEVEHDVLAGAPLDVSGVPLCITLTRLGAHFVVDATRDEERCADGSLVLAVNAAGSVCAMQQLGAPAALPAALLFSMLSAAKAVAPHLLTRLNAVLEAERAQQRSTSVGYLTTTNI